MCLITATIPCMHLNWGGTPTIYSTYRYIQYIYDRSFIHLHQLLLYGVAAYGPIMFQ